MDNSPILEEDMLKLQQIEDQVKQDTQAINLLIQEYRLLLERLQTDKASILSASLQFDLGNAYYRLPSGDRAANLQQAITCYQEALRIWTANTAPQKYAITQNKLGVAYHDLPTGNREDNLKRAIACYRKALRIWTPVTAPLDYARTQTNLGIAYRALFTSGSTINLERAIDCYREALRFQNSRTAPLDYAMTQHNLGNAYGDLPTGDRATNLKRAFTCYREALRFWTPETAPLAYAWTQNNLGNAYSNLPTGNHAANLAQAIICYQEALRFRTLEATPNDCRLTNRNLANMHFEHRNWKAALSAYRAAMDAGEQLYRAGLSAESKAAEMADNIALYHYAAFSAVRCGHRADALLVLERGKARLLAEALRLHVPRPINVPNEVWMTFERACADVRSIQSGETIISSERRDLVQDYMTREHNTRIANAALDAAIEQVRIYSATFLHSISMSTIQSLLPDEHTVLVAFCITDQGSIGFVVGYNQNVQVAEVPDFTQTKLRSLFAEQDANGRIYGGWLGAYHRHLMEQTQAALAAWQATITNTLTMLGQILLAPIISTFPPGIERIIFLPSAELFLLPLHAVPLSDTSSERLCDRYQVSYTPSIEVLSDTTAKTMQGTAPELYAVINPQADPR